MLYNSSKRAIIDVRSGTDGITMRNDLLQKLQPGDGHEKKFPTILLYDEIGLKLFEEITYLDDYYLTNAEIELLETGAVEIAQRLTPGSMIVELGSGNLRKTGILLAALDELCTPFEYFALDLSLSELERTLAAVPVYRNIRISGLHGTYDDGLGWLSQPQNRGRPKCVMSLGSSIGNFNPQEAAQFLQSVGTCLAPGRDHLLIGLDGCQDAQRVYTAYNDAKGTTKKFILNGLTHANKILGEEAFRVADWEYIGEYDQEFGRHQAFISPTKSVSYYDVFIRSGEKVRIEESYKFSSNQKAEVWAEAGLVEVAEWGPTQQGLPYYVHLLSPRGP
ncbi:histidine-specific methyltransferase [Xylariaceae sp. AK1471]|nr:histidine-specific methyltransferase [Xylariaceae sp. AK1471]